MIRLKKYLNPHENYCSKVISILTTGNILHESSSAPRQHKPVQYKWCTLFLHRDVSHTDLLQLHFISCRWVLGAGGNMHRFRDLVLSLFYRGGPMVLLLRKLYLSFTKDPEVVHYFPGGWCQTFSKGGGGGGGGANANFFRNPCTYLFFSGGWGCPDPLSPSGSAHGQCHHNGRIFITVPLLTIIVRH